MEIRLNPYLAFRDTAREALSFYAGIFGGEPTIMTFADLPGLAEPEESEKVVHGMLLTPRGLVLMAADTPNRMELAAGNAISVSVSGDDAPELTGYFEKLAAGGEIAVPLAKAPWGDHFGMCTDRFGVPWLVNITEAA